MAAQTPVIPSLNLDEASAAVVDKKKSFGKIKNSFKKILSTPRTGSASELESMVKTEVTNASAAVTDAVKAGEDAAKAQASRLGDEANAAKAEVTGAIKKAADDDNVKKAIGAVVAVVAVIAAAIAASGSKKKEVPPPPVKKGWF